MIAERSAYRIDHNTATLWRRCFTFLVGVAPLVAVATVLIDQWMLTHHRDEHWLPYWITAVVSCVIAWLVGYWSPIHSRRPTAHSTRLRVLALCLVAITGCLSAYIAMLVTLLLGVDMRSFHAGLETVVLCAAIIGAGAVVGGMWRGWPMLNGRERMYALLATQWLLWPKLLPDLVYLVVTFLGFPKEVVEPLLGEPRRFLLGMHYAEVLMIGASLIGALSIVRVWSFGLTSAAVGLLLYWSALTALIYDHRIAL